MNIMQEISNIGIIPVIKINDASKAVGLAKALIFARGSFTMELFFTIYFVTGLPGITIHIIVVPFLYAALEKARLIPVRY